MKVHPAFKFLKIKLKSSNDFRLQNDLLNMTIHEFTVHVDKPSGQYISGESVTGKVHLQVSGAGQASEITIRFFGLAHTDWLNYEHYHGIGHSGGHHQYYSGDELLFEVYVRVFGNGVNKFTLPTGEFSYPFAVQVPTRPLPVSCSFEAGRVTYGLEACIKNPGADDTTTKPLPVTIFTMVDLNITPGAENPVVKVDSRLFDACCTPHEPFFIQTFTPRLGFTAGEVIPLSVEIQNKSNRSLVNVNAALVQVFTLIGFPPSPFSQKLERITLFSVEKGSIPPKQDTKWDVYIQIPLGIAPSPSPGACRIIQMEYVIHVWGGADGGCCSSYETFELSHPVIIGTVPLVASKVVTVQTPAYNETGGLA